MKPNKVRLIQMVDGQMLKSEFAIEHAAEALKARGFEVVGRQGQRSPGGIEYREEITGQPLYAELAGPMYDGEGVVRYEDIEVCEVLSR